MRFRFAWVIPIILSFGFCATKIHGQTKSETSIPLDSVKTETNSFMSRMQDFAKKSAKESIEDFKSDKVSMVQLEVINQIRLTIQDAKGYLKTKTDTAGLKTRLSRLKEDYHIASDGVLNNRGTTQTYRNLASTKRILNELFLDAKKSKSLLETRQRELASYHYRIDSLSTAPELFIFPKDSAQTMDYVRTLASVAVDAAPVDSVLKISNTRVQKLLYSYNLIMSELQNEVEQVEGYERQMAEETFTRELPNIWQKQLHFRPFKDIVRFSLNKNVLTLKFYIINNAGKLSLIVFLILGSFIYLNALRSIYLEKGLLSKDMNGQLSIRYPALSAVLVVLSLFQFLLVSPPFILNFIIWIISCISLTIVFKNFITPYWMKVWLSMVVFFIFASAGNLLLQASRPERWYMLALSVIGAVAGILILRQKRDVELREKWIAHSIFVMVCIELISIILNIYGRFNLAKTLFLVGFLNVIIAILFLWVVRLINEGLLLAFEVYTVQDKKLFYLNFGKVGSKAPSLLYVLLVLGWVILLGHNFPLFEFLSKPVLEFMSTKRSLGNYSFSINGILLFFIIMTISVILSKIVSFFTSDDHLNGSKGNNENNRGLGSWVLLLRISILSIGLFLAVAAAGIPMERITIIIGALGVGIGFGLQTLVNNLVSGLIIAFEKPVNVGDIVDVDGQGGTMKSIGFRSSVISTWEGGDLVMPNGDLLNSHLMNWTLSGNRRRLSMEIGIAYDSDLQKCREIINKILEEEDRVLKNPKPAVNFELFGSSSIELKIQLWTRHLRENNPTRNDLIMAINDAFSKNGIKIPINQQDIYLHQAVEQRSLDKEK
ncbi:mechanosensitive ion channel [Pedobacter sp. MC2016-05]|uniref:mechanosensitive ion channel family protein n=1 Tax=Pedobacter sp. MC2016-05 TaxID=2994474 RepID=UPI00224813C7|nr:mechanosensitive ion channel domain-containing protein [Pedobacter sp. MC2016-05]MCX2477023.1 mechanosensitive ion channel [Pedobacter sp. MC2016-05]